MADFFQKITEHQGSLEDLIRKVPGFKGYLELEDRRDADRLLREQLARSFEEQVAALGIAQQEIISAGGLQHLEHLQRIDTKLRTFIDRIQSAAQGYSSLFSPIKVGADGLRALYAFDNGLIAYRDQMETGISALRDATAEGDVAGILRQLDAIVTEANDTFKRRVEAIQNLSEAV